jgi:hypothetical protein
MSQNLTALLPVAADVRRPASRKAGSAQHEGGLVTSSATSPRRSAGGLRAFNQFLRKRCVAIAIWCVLLLALAFQMPRFRGSKSSKATAQASQRVTKSFSVSEATTNTAEVTPTH